MRPDKIAILIKKAALEFDKMSNPVLSEHDLTPSQYRVLKYLYTQAEKKARIVDIEKECSITHPTALGILDNLEKKGFVQKRVNPEDARSKVISLTKKAIGMQKQLESLGDELENMLTEGLSKEEKKELLSLLEKLLTTVEEKH